MDESPATAGLTNPQEIVPLSKDGDNRSVWARLWRRKRMRLATILVIACVLGLMIWRWVGRHERIVDFTTGKPTDESVFDKDDLSALGSLATVALKGFVEIRGAEYIQGFTLKGVGVWTTDANGKKSYGQIQKKDSKAPDGIPFFAVCAGAISPKGLPADKESFAAEWREYIKKFDMAFEYKHGTLQKRVSIVDYDVDVLSTQYPIMYELCVKRIKLVDNATPTKASGTLNADQMRELMGQ